jgi:hypothetical protein
LVTFSTYSIPSAGEPDAGVYSIKSPGLEWELALREPGLEPLRRAVEQLPVAVEHNLEVVEQWRGLEGNQVPAGRGW